MIIREGGKTRKIIKQRDVPSIASLSHAKFIAAETWSRLVLGWEARDEDQVLSGMPEVE